MITTHKRKNGEITLAVAFRGTADLDDALADFNCGLEPTKHFSPKTHKCLVHSGFQDRYEWYRKNILNEIETMGSKFDEILITGHSLGGALATLCYMELSQKRNKVYICSNCTLFFRFSGLSLIFSLGII